MHALGHCWSMRWERRCRLGPSAADFVRDYALQDTYGGMPTAMRVAFRPKRRNGIHIHVPLGVYDGQVRRIQIHLDEDMDEAAQREASRRGISKAALIRTSLARELRE